MDDLNSKKAAPLIDYTFKEIGIQLTTWRDCLRNELEVLIYIKNCLMQEMNDQGKGDSIQNQKIIRLIPKLECICLKEIDLMNEFRTQMNHSQYVENSEELYSKVESIRENYNKVIVNIQKMFNNVSMLEDYRDRYLKSLPMIPQMKDSGLSSQQLKEKTIDEVYKEDIDIGIDYEHEKEMFNKKINEPRHGNTRNNNNNNKTKTMTSCNTTMKNINKNMTDIKKSNTKGIMFTNSKQSNLLNKNNNDICLTDIPSNVSKTISKLPSSYPRTFNNKRSATPLNNQRTANPLNISLNNKATKSNESNAIEALNEEIQHIKSYFDEMNKTRQQYCLIENDKQAFEKIKKENIKLVADVSILKDDMNDLLKCFQTLNARVGRLQLDNDNLRQQNENLIAYIATMNNGNNINEISAFGNGNNNHCINKRVSEISDMSPFNSNVFISNNQPINRGKAEQDQEIRQVTDCYSNNNNNNITSNCAYRTSSSNQMSPYQIKTSYTMKEKRFLIPKNE